METRSGGGRCGNWYGDWHGTASLISLCGQTNYGIWTTGIEKTEGGLDAWQSVSVLQGVRCVFVIGAAQSWDWLYYIIYVRQLRHHYRPRRKVNHLRNFSEYIQGHHQRFDYNQTFGKGTLVSDQFGYYCITGVSTGIGLSTFGTLFFGHRKATDIAMLSRNIV